MSALTFLSLLGIENLNIFYPFIKVCGPLCIFNINYLLKLLSKVIKVGALISLLGFFYFYYNT